MDHLPPPVPDAELALPDYEEVLWTALRDEHRVAAGGEPALVGAAASTAVVVPLDATARRRRTIRRSLRTAVAAAAVAAVAIGGAVVLDSTSDPVDDEATAGGAVAAPSADGSAPTPQTLEAEVIAAIDEAVAGSIVFVRQDHDSGYRSQDWSDEVSGASRSLYLEADGSPLFDVGLVTAPDPDAPSPRAEGDEPDPSELMDPETAPSFAGYEIDHCFDEYVEEALPVYPTDQVQQIADGLADGSMVLDGSEVIDGRELLRVLDVQPIDAPPADLAPGELPVWPPETIGEAPSEDIVTYIDAETHRPVMVRGYAGTEAGYTMHIEFLERTPGNLANLVAELPAGYAEVPQLRGDAARAAAGCT